jgi:hypothetical protein
MARLLKTFKGDLPSDPAAQNGAWYRLYKTVRDDVIVLCAHKVFLLLRDYTALSCFFLVVFGPWALIFMTDKWVAGGYVGSLVLQYALVRQGAANVGIRVVERAGAQDRSDSVVEPFLSLFPGASQ